jgi:hypothetical protein
MFIIIHIVTYDVLETARCVLAKNNYGKILK